MQDFHLGEADLAQQVQLEQQRAGRIFLLDVGENMVPVGFILQPGQVLAVTPAHEFLDRRDRTLDQIEDPHRAARPQCPVERCEDIPPLLVGAQVVHHRSRQHDVELPVRKFNIPNVALDSRDVASGRPADPLSSHQQRSCFYVRLTAEPALILGGRIGKDTSRPDALTRVVRALAAYSSGFAHNSSESHEAV